MYALKEAIPFSPSFEVNVDACPTRIRFSFFSSMRGGVGVSHVYELSIPTMHVDEVDMLHLS